MFAARHWSSRGRPDRRSRHSSSRSATVAASNDTPSGPPGPLTVIRRTRPLDTAIDRATPREIIGSARGRRVTGVRRLPTGHVFTTATPRRRGAPVSGGILSDRLASGGRPMWATIAGFSASKCFVVSADRHGADQRVATPSERTDRGPCRRQSVPPATGIRRQRVQQPSLAGASSVRRRPPHHRRAVETAAGGVVAGPGPPGARPDACRSRAVEVRRRTGTRRERTPDVTGPPVGNRLGRSAVAIGVKK